MGGVAQCYGESVAVLVLRWGYARVLAKTSSRNSIQTGMKALRKILRNTINCQRSRNFSAAFHKACEKNGRGGPVIVEIPGRLWTTRRALEPLNLTPGADANTLRPPTRACEGSGGAVGTGAKRPVIY